MNDSGAGEIMMPITRKVSSIFDPLVVIVKRYEYKLLVQIWSVCVLIFTVMSIIVNLVPPESEFTVNQLINATQENYGHIIFTTHRYHTNCLYYAGNSVRLYAESGTNLQVEVLMQSNESIYDEYSFRRFTDILNSGEIAISRNIAVRNNLRIGDKITISYPAFYNDIQVVITDFFDDAFGIRRPHLNNGVAIMGYDHLIAENTHMFVSFVSYETILGDDFIFFTQNQGIIEMSEKIRLLWLDIVFAIVIPIVILCAIQLFACFFFVVKSCASYYNRHIMLGRRTASLKNEVRVDCLMIYLPIAVIAFLINTVVVRITLGHIFSYTALILFIFQCLTVFSSYRLTLRKILR